MGSNPSNQFFNVLARANMANAAGQSAMGGPLSKLGGFFANAISSGAGGDGSFGILPGLAGGIQSLQRGRFIEDTIRRQQQAAAYQQWQDEQKAQQAATVYQHATGGLISGQGGTPDAATLNTIRENNQNPYTQNYLQTGQLGIAPHGKYDPQMVRDYMTRANQFIDTQSTLKGMPQFQQQAFNPNFGGQPPQQQQPVGGQPQGPTQDPTGRHIAQNAAYIAPGQEQGLQAGTQFTAPPPINPALQYGPANVGIPNVDQLLAGQRRATDIRQQMEVERANQAQEKLKQDVHQATVQNKGGYARYRPTGGSGSNPYTQVKTQQDITMGQIKDVDRQLEQAFGKKDGKIKIPKDPKSPEFMKYKRFMDRRRTLETRLDQGFPQISAPGGGGTVPFGGGSAGGLSQSQQELIKRALER